MGFTAAEQANERLVELRGVSVDYGLSGSAFRAVENVSFTIRRGDFVVIIGPSGCGKSTILNTIAGFTRATDGEVLINEMPVSGPGPDRAVVHQQTAALLPWLDVEQNVGLPLKVRRVARDEREKVVAEYLALVSLQNFAHHKIYQLSGGMQQRVALARALAAESPIVLLDEPLGALDALQREIMQDFLLDVWHKTDRTFLLITHSVEEATYLATHVLVMTTAPGRVLWESDFDFGRRALLGGGASIKQKPEFVAAQAGLLSLLRGELREPSRSR